MILILFLVPVFELAVPAQSTEPSSTPSESNQQIATVADTGHEAELIETIKKGDLAEVLRLLDNGMSPDATDSDRSPALCWAVRVNRADIVEALLARKAKVDQEENDGGTALQVAAAAGRADLVKLLIAHRANVNQKDNGGHTSLMLAAFGVMFKNAPDWITKELFDVDEEDRATLASMGDEHVEVVKLLLRSGADANAQAEDCGLTPLMIAAMGGNVELGRILLAAGAKVDTGSEESSALKFAEMGESPEELQKMLDDETDNESKQAMLSWLNLTRPGRREFAAMLRKAGAKN